MPETTPLIKAALNLRGGAGFDVYTKRTLPVFPETSFCYNPFAYVRDDKDVLKLINNLIRNTTPKGAQSSDPFWESATCS